MGSISLFIVGLLGLWLGAEITVRQGVFLARRLRMSGFLIGSTILAFGTDLPELILSIQGAIQTVHGNDSTGLIIGNAIGSSICQIGFALGLAACFRTLHLPKSKVKVFSIGLLVSIATLFVLGWLGTLTPIMGGILLVVFMGIYWMLIKSEDPHPEIDITPIPQTGSRVNSLVMLVMGLVVVIVSAEFVIIYGLKITETLGLQQSMVGAVFIALGSSLPEIAVSLLAGLRGRVDLSIGNILGSNIFDVLVPIGLAATIVPMTLDATNLYVDIPFLFLLSVIVIVLLASKGCLRRNDGLGLIGLYALYVGIRTML